MGGHTKSNGLLDISKPEKRQHILVFSEKQDRSNALNHLADCDLVFVPHRGQVEQLAITKLLALCSQVSSDLYEAR